MFVLLLLSLLAASAVAQTGCPEPYGLQLYPHESYCDQYYKCANGTLTLETCGNGLLFDGTGNVHNYCNYYWAVQCGNRVYELLEARTAEGCQYHYGIFPRSAGCEVAYTKCAAGLPFDEPCGPGLVYDDRIHGCQWPDLMLDVCDPEQIVGFKCPIGPSADPVARLFDPYPRFATNDCARFITCVNSYPRVLSCGYGSVFNQNSLSCDIPENVPQCSNYYKK